MLKLVIYIACSLVFGLLADYLTRRSDDNRSHYRYGYFVVGFFSLVAMSSMYSLVGLLQDGVLSISDLLVAGLGAIAAAGIARKRRYGWWAGVLLVLSLATLVVITVGRDALWIATAAGMVAVLVVAVSIRYARRHPGNSRPRDVSEELRNIPAN